MARYTSTQQKVLSGMAVATAATIADSAEPVTGALLDVRTIARSAHVSEYRTIQALHGLANRGDVETDAIHGMAGSLRLYKLNPALTAAAIRRFQ